MSTFAIANVLQNARDGITKALSVVDYSHHEIHSGSGYYVEGHTALSDTEELNVKFVTPNSAKQCHFVWTIEVTGETEIDLYEDAVGGMAGGTTLTVLNNNRNSTKSSSMAFVSGVTTSTAVGTQLHNWITGAAGNPSRNVPGNGSERADEIILKTNATYLGRIVSNSTGNNVAFRASWYEHAPDTGLKVAD